MIFKAFILFFAINPIVSAETRRYLVDPNDMRVPTKMVSQAAAELNNQGAFFTMGEPIIDEPAAEPAAISALPARRQLAKRQKSQLEFDTRRIVGKLKQPRLSFESLQGATELSSPWLERRKERQSLFQIPDLDL